jgi:hypothetical protein
MADGMNRFLGDTPGRTLIKLVIVSVLVGFVMNAFGLDPYDVLRGIRRFFLELWYSGFAALGTVWRYTLIGGAIVIPVFIIIRLLSYRKS